MFNYISFTGNFRFSDDQLNIYKTLGGTPFLDGTYTVFGEVTEGLDIVDKIAATPTSSNDKPLQDIKILSMKILNN